MMVMHFPSDGLHEEGWQCTPAVGTDAWSEGVEDAHNVGFHPVVSVVDHSYGVHESLGFVVHPT